MILPLPWHKWDQKTYSSSCNSLLEQVEAVMEEWQLQRLG